MVCHSQLFFNASFGKFFEQKLSNIHPLIKKHHFAVYHIKFDPIKFDFSLPLNLDDDSKQRYILTTKYIFEIFFMITKIGLALKILWRAAFGVLEGRIWTFLEKCIWKIYHFQERGIIYSRYIFKGRLKWKCFGLNFMWKTAKWSLLING